MDYRITEFRENSWIIEEEGVRFFLLAGKERALLVDCGMKITNGLDIAKTLTDLPIELIITHADRDHIGSYKQFDYLYMHSAEAVNLYNNAKAEISYKPVEDEQVIDLGARELTVVLIPGHTPGSIALLDKENHFLISGDPIQDGRIFMFGMFREMNSYLASLRKLDKYRLYFDEIYPSHASCPVKPALIDELYEAGTKLVNGQLAYEEVEMFGKTIKAYDGGCAIFLKD